MRDKSSILKITMTNISWNHVLDYGANDKLRLKIKMKQNRFEDLKKIQIVI